MAANSQCVATVVSRKPSGGNVGDERERTVLGRWIRELPPGSTGDEKALIRAGAGGMGERGWLRRCF